MWRQTVRRLHYRPAHIAPHKFDPSPIQMRIQHILEKYEDKNVTPIRNGDVTRISYLMRRQSKKGHFEKIVKNWDRMERLGATPTKYTAPIVMKALRTLGAPNQALKVFARVPESHHSPHLFCTAIASCKEFDTATAIFDRMNTEMVDLAVMNALLSVAQTEEEMDRIMNDMKARDIVADSITYNFMIRILTRNGNLEKAMSVFSGLQEEELYIDMFSNLLELCYQQRKYSEATLVWNRNKEAHFSLVQSSYLFMMALAHLHKDVAMVNAVLEEALELHKIKVWGDPRKGIIDLRSKLLYGSEALHDASIPLLRAALESDTAVRALEAGHSLTILLRKKDKLGSLIEDPSDLYTAMVSHIKEAYPHLKTAPLESSLGLRLKQ